MKQIKTDSLLKRKTMKLPVPSFFRWHPILSCFFVGLMFSLFVFSYNFLSVNQFKENPRIPVSLIGVQHLGSDYRIDRFYVDKSISDNIGEGGGGGSMVCCLTLPKTWSPNLKADVRWEVHRIVKNPHSNEKTAKVVGIYQALVPVEQYSEPGDFFVHFFPGARVRIVVSEVGSDGTRHPIQWGDIGASRSATIGKEIRSMFTIEEIDEFQRKLEKDRKKYGDWR